MKIPARTRALARGIGAGAVAAGTLAATAPDVRAQDGQDGDLKIGLLLPFTGQYAWVGSNVQPVARMIAHEVNASGGIGGREIAFAQGDTEGVVDAGTTAAQKLVNVDDVLAILGPTSLSFSGARQPILRNDVPMVSPTAGTTALDRACRDVCFRTVPSDSLGGRAIARAATDAQYLAGEEAARSDVVLMVGNAPAMVSFKEPIARAFEATARRLRRRSPTPRASPATAARCAARSRATPIRSCWWARPRIPPGSCRTPSRPAIRAAGSSPKTRPTPTSSSSPARSWSRGFTAWRRSPRKRVPSATARSSSASASTPVRTRKSSPPTPSTP